VTTNGTFLKPDQYTAKILGIDLTPDSAGVTRELNVPGNTDKIQGFIYLRKVTAMPLLGWTGYMM